MRGERSAGRAIGTLVGYRSEDGRDGIRVALLLPGGRAYRGWLRSVQTDTPPGIAFEGTVAALGEHEAGRDAALGASERHAGRVLANDDAGACRLRLEPLDAGDGTVAGVEFGGVLRVSGNTEGGAAAVFDVRAEYRIGGDVALEGAIVARGAGVVWS